MIPAIQELNFPKIEGKQYATLTHATATLADMGEKTITTQVKIDGEIVPDFSYDWEVEFQGEKYIMPLRIPQGVKENTSLNSTIDLTFQHWAIYQLKRWTFVTMQPIQAGTAIADEEVADVQLNLKDLCDLFGQVLEYYYGDTITIDLNPAWQYDNAPTLITINHSYIWDVLIKFHELFAVRWAIEPRKGNDNRATGGERYVIKVGYPTTEADHIFEYGFEGGLLKLERQVQSDEIRNMIKGRGGETNIPLRYFKGKDPNNPDFKPDPDWVEELANIYLPNLMPATFRSYIQGWKAAHISRYPGYTPMGEGRAYAPWAYRKGYTDTKFHPVEYVKDDESIAKYGPLPATLDNNDDIYPTIQGTGLDVAVAVEQIKSDDVEESVENDAKVSGFEDKGRLSKAEVLDGNGRKTVEIISGTFTVDKGKKANLDEGPKTFKVYKDEKYVGLTTKKDKLTLTVQKIPIEVGGYLVEAEDVGLAVVNALTGEERSASGIPEGVYFFRLRMTLHNTTKNKLKVVVSCESPTVTSATLESDNWKNTFNIWVKNIWESSKQNDESDDAYAERVWKPILGDRQRNTAKVVFTSGALWHEDYEFTIVGFPAPDSSKSHNGDVSHWRIKLAKSEAELETTGLYVPSTQKQGKAGDTFAFVGTELTHVPYVVQAEIALDEWKKDHLREVKEIKPTFVVTTDRVRLGNEGRPDALINQLRAGNSLRIADKRFVQPMGDRAYETLYLQSLTYAFREPSSDDAALNPDVEIVLGNEYATSANPVSVMQGEISALQKQVGSRSNLEQVVRAVGDRLYLRKDGVSDRSLSPTRFFSLLTSGDFRPGLVGGAGWGFYKDENGNWVLEADRVSVRQEMQVNTLVINQAEGRGGMEIDTAAFMEVERVEETESGYVCYFDQKDGSVANLFHVDDVAFCNRWTPENQELKFYKRRVVAVGVDSVTLTKPLSEAQRPAKWPDSGVNGTGVPAEKDNIIHFGSYTDKTRQYVKVRDVVGGGYERYIEELNSVNAKGVEYYFVGKQAGESRWFVGNKDLVPYSGKGDGSYIEYINRRFNLNNVTLSINTNIGDKTLAEYIKLVSPPVEQEDIEDFVNAIVDPRIDGVENKIDGVEGKLDGIQGQIDGVIESFFGFGAPTLDNYPANEWTTDEARKAHERDTYTDKTEYVDDVTTPTAGQSWRWQYTSPTDYGWVKIANSDAVKALLDAAKAQDTADRKRRIFTQQPTPPYDKGDLWVNATYPSGNTLRDPANGKYYNDILRCGTSWVTGSFAIGDWGLSSNYTDDTLAQAAKNAADKAQADADKAESDAKAAKDRLDAWAADGVISPTEKQGIKDEISRIDADKAHITAEYTRYNLGTPTTYNNAHKDYRQQLVALSATTPENITIPSTFASNQTAYYNARTTALSALAAAAKKYAEDIAKQEAEKAVAGFEYLKEAIVDGVTQFAGGLMLSSHIRLGEWDKSNPDKPVMSKVWAGMNGIYSNTALGRTIASWWGGDMVDLFDVNDVRKKPRPANAATSLVRMNGSAYFADGNIGFRADGSGWLGNDLTGIKFDNNGSMTFGSGVRFDVENVEGLKTTLETLGNFNIGLSTLLIPCDANGVPLKGGWAEATKSDGAGGIKAKGVKATVDFFSDGGVTALGHGSGTGGGGGTGGGLYGLMTEWTTGSAATRSDALGANLGWELHTVKLDRAEAAGLYQPKGNYLTSHQSLAHLLKVDGSNGTASGVSELIRKLDGSVTAALTDATLIVTSNANGEASDHKYYRRPASALWSYVRGKGGSEWVTVSTAQTIKGAKIFGSGKLSVSAGDPNYTRILRSTNTAIPTSDRDYAWQIYHATEGSGFRGLSIWSYDGDSKVFNQVATFKAHGGNKLVVSGSVYATSLIRSGGTSAQFLKADGSVDSNSYLTTGAASSAYVKKAGDVMTGMLTTAGLVVPRDKYVYGVNEEGGSMLHFDGTRTVVGSIGEHSTAPTHLRSKTKHLTCGDNGTSYTVWDSGNDGSGSGLDADLLDGTHKSGLFTGLSNNGATNNLSVTVGGVSKEVRVSAVGGYLTMTVSKNDNYGRPVYLLIADVTTWYNTTTSGAGDTGIVGYLYGRRGGNLAGTSVQKIIAWCSYNNSYYRLQSDTDDSSAVLPRIVRYNDKYYLALYMRGSGRDHCFIGFKSSNLLSTFITVNADSSGAFEGLTVVHSEEGMAHFGNASTATRLQGTYSIWGQNFYGNNVSGNMTGVGDINTASAPIGTVYSSNWFRSTGSSGWRSETYGGGWYMQDSTWIRSLGNKGLYMGTGTVRTDGSIVVGASEVFKVDPSGNVKANTLKIGRAEISWDEASTALKISTDVYSVKGVTALGSSGGATGGGGGASYGLIRNWGHTPAPTESTNDALGANLGWDLDRRLRSVESGAAVTVSTTGSGNAVTAISKSGTVITATKGATFLTAHQSLANYYTKSEVDSNFFRAYGTSNANIDSDWGQSVKTFDPVPSGTPPEQNANITLLSLGNSVLRRKMLAFCYNNDNIYYRRNNSGNLSQWVKLLHTGNYSTVLDSRYYTKSEVDAKNYIKDRTNGTATYLNYGASGVTTASWLAAWNGYELRAMSPANVRACISAVSKAGDTMTGALQIDINSATKHLGFGRAGYNYIGATAPGGVLGFTANGKALGVAANCDMIIEDNAVFPGTTNVGSLGKSAYRWANLYATTINVTSQALVGNLNADMLDGQHGAYYQSRVYDAFVSQHNAYDYIEFLRCVIPAGTSFLRDYIVFDLTRTETGGEQCARVVLRIRRSSDNTASFNFFASNFGSTAIPELKVTSDDGITYKVWVKCRKTEYDPYLAVKIVESNVYGHWSLVNNGMTGTPAGTKYNVTCATAGIASKLAVARTLWGQSFDGSGNVSGSLSGVGTITGSGTLVLVGNSHIYLKCGDSNAKSLVLNDSAFKPFDTAGGRLSLGSASARWSNTYSVLGNFSGLVTASAGIRIGEATISWDADKLALRIDRDVYSDRGVTALGSTGSQGGPTGGGYGRYEDETWAKTPASGDVLAAKLGVQLHNRVKSLEGKNYLDALNLTTTGGGNAVTAVSLSADKKSLTVTKGASFSLSDHRHGLLHHDFATTLASTTTDDGWSMINSSYHGFILKSLRMGSSAPGWVLGNYAAGVCFGGADTKGVLSCSYSSPAVRFAGGNGSKPVWHLTLTGTSGATYNLANLLTSASAESTFVKKSGSTMTGRLVINGGAASQPLMVRGIVGQDGSGTVEALYLQYGANKPVFFGNGGTHNISADGSAYSGNSATATALKTARSINGTPFNGSADITTSHWGSARDISIADSASANTGTAVSVNGSANVTLKLPATIKAALAGNASSATQLQTARRLTIGGTGKDFNGTAALSWSLDEIGVYSKSAADGRFVNVTGDSMTGSLNMVNGSAKVNVTDGAGADDGYGFVNVTRKNESADLAYFSMVKAGVGAYGIGVGPGGMILGSAVYSSDGKRKMNPWLTLDGSAMTVQGNILPASNNASEIGSPKAGFFRRIYANNVSSEGEMTIYSGSGGMIYFDPDGLIAVNHDIPEYEFDIKGTMRADNILSNGSVTALKSTTTSDMRLKKVLGQLELRVEDIAGAPSFVHLWRHETPFGDEEQAGTSAQYWLGVLPQAVDRSGRWLALDYGKTALLSAIALARRSQTHEERIAELEAEVERLRGMLGERSA